MVQSMWDDLGALAALDRRRKQHKSNVLARNVLAHQMANAKHRYATPHHGHIQQGRRYHNLHTHGTAATPSSPS